MLNATTTLAQPWRRIVPRSKFPGCVSDAQVMAEMARRFTATPYLFGGRGEAGQQGYDGFGMVRACAETVVGRPLPDLTDYLRYPVGAEPTYDACYDVLVAWGMQRVDGVHPLPTRPGDVIVSHGLGPTLSIVVAVGNHDRGQLVAMVWPGHPCEIRSNTALGRAPLRAYRWPDPASGDPQRAAEAA